MTFTAVEVARAVRGRILTGRPETSARGLAIDSRLVEAGQAFVALQGSRVDGHEFVGQAFEAGASFALVHRDVEAPEERPLVRVEDTKAALAALGTHLRVREELTVVGVTGSAGKTSTKVLLAAALEAEASPGSYNTVYGLPLTLANLPEETRRVVLEMGISAPGEMDVLARIVAPDVMVLLNVAPAHTEKLPSLERIAEEKAASLHGLREGGGAVWNADDEILERAVLDALPEGARRLRFGASEDADLRLLDHTTEGLGASRSRVGLPDGGEIELSLRMPGRHAALNALAALGAGLLLGEDPEKMARRLSSPEPPEGRGRLVEIGRIRVLDDSYNANPRSMEAALGLLAGARATRRIAVLGDMRELGESSRLHHEELGRRAAEAGVDLLLLVGEESAAAAEPARAAGLEEVLVFANAAEAGARLAETARPGDLVLVKGSRAVGTEQVIEALRAAQGEGG